MRPALPSNRSFGWTFTGFFILAGAYGLWHGGAASLPMLVLAAVLALVTLARAAWLTPLNRAWMKLGGLMGRVVWGGASERPRPSYWVKRDPPGPADDSYRNMF